MDGGGVEAVDELTEEAEEEIEREERLGRVKGELDETEEEEERVEALSRIAAMLAFSLSSISFKEIMIRLKEGRTSGSEAHKEVIRERQAGGVDIERGGR